MSARPAWIGQALRFGMVAPLVFAVDWSVLHLLVGLGIPPLAARVGSLAASVGVGFLLNRAFTFRAAGRPTGREFGRYLLAAGLGIATNYGVFAAAHRLGLPDPAAIAAGMLAAAAVTFTRFRAVFARR
jgi:putative flippase GtrA